MYFRQRNFLKKGNIRIKTHYPNKNNIMRTRDYFNKIHLTDIQLIILYLLIVINLKLLKD